MFLVNTYFDSKTSNHHNLDGFDVLCFHFHEIFTKFRLSFFDKRKSQMHLRSINFRQRVTSPRSDCKLSYVSAARVVSEITDYCRQVLVQITICFFLCRASSYLFIFQLANEFCFEQLLHFIPRKNLDQLSLVRAGAIKRGATHLEAFLHCEAMTILSLLQGRLSYYIGGEMITLCHLEHPMYLLGYLPKEDRVYLIDKQQGMFSYRVRQAMLQYQVSIQLMISVFNIRSRKYCSNHLIAAMLTVDCGDVAGSFQATACARQYPSYVKLYCGILRIVFVGLHVPVCINLFSFLRNASRAQHHHLLCG